MARVLWRADAAGAREAFLNGEPWDVGESDYGLNEHLMAFLRTRGWWERLTGYRPTLGKENGKDPQALNGAWVMVNLAHLGYLEHADPLLRDGQLMMDVGFTMREVREARRLQRGVVHRDTLRNHCKRIPLAESERVFYGSVAWMRRRKGLRGGWYAADGFQLEVTGEQYEGAGKVWDKERKRWVRGYKAVVLLLVTAGRERLAGLALGPIQADERKLLREILEALRRHGIEPKEMIEGLILDRGYWGTEFLQMLREEYGLHWCIPVPAHVGLVSVMHKLMASGRVELQTRTVRYRSGRKEKLEVGHAADLVVTGEKKGATMAVQAVVARRVEAETGEVQERVFATTVPFGEQPPTAVIERYSERWAVENEGIREFSQRWRARVPIARKFAAIYAQLRLLAMCYNAMKDYAMKRPKDAAVLQEQCRRRARRSYLARRGVILYIPGRRIYAAMGAVEFSELRQERLVRYVRRLIASGYSSEEALERAREAC